MTQSELDKERSVVAELYERLDALRADTERRLIAVRGQRVGGNHQARSERDAFAQLHEDRLIQLREVDSRLVFGRLQLDAEPTGDQDGSTGARGADPLQDPALRYIGRMGLRDNDQHALLIDWRAPQASAFYQATAAEPQGVRARRHLTMSGRQVLRVDDEVFDERMLREAAERGVEVQGEGALMAAVTAQRTGHMHDIVATIQAEQDRIIRSDLRGALVVQGGPGTGKTAVALHRAAYLLYANRERLGSSGVLVVGPSDAFLSYIEAVLPSLGETGVVMQTVGELFPGVQAFDDDPPQTARIKGSAQMAKLLARAVHTRQIVPQGPQTIDINGEKLTVLPDLIARAMTKAQRTGKPHNVARVTFVKAALDALTDQLAAQLEAHGSTLDDADRSVLREDLRTSYDVRVLLNTAWLPLTPQKLLRDLYARPAWLEQLAPKWNAQTRALLERDRRHPFTVSDVPLLDEAAELLGDAPEPSADARERERKRARERDLENARNAIENMGVEGLVSAERLVDDFGEHAAHATTAERALNDRTWTYGHVVVDEAQELSPMQWRMLVRRCPMRSFTIVGDIAQVASAAGATDWAQALDPFFRDHWRLEQLTVNYRTPAQISNDADAYARRRGLPITPARAVREGEWPVERMPSAGDLETAVTSAVGCVRAGVPVHDAEGVRQGAAAADRGGTLAVIAPASRLTELRDRLVAEFGSEAVGAGAAGLTSAIAVLTARDAKGLEFDDVVLADPQGIEAESPRGASALYVSMTRPTQRLVIVG